MAVWAAYREKRGPLNVGMRLEHLFAMSDYRSHLSKGGKLKFDDFIRYHDMPEAEQQEPDLMMVAKLFGAPVQIRKPKKSKEP